MIPLPSALFYWAGRFWDSVKRNVRIQIAIFMCLWLVACHMLKVMKRIEDLIATIGTIAVPDFPDPNINLAFFALANHFIPIDLALSLAIGWLNLYVLCVAVRVVKAWIPTMN